MTADRTAETVLHNLLRDGDVYEAAGRRFFVAPIDDPRLDDLIAAAGATEDDEDGGDAEPETEGDELDAGEWAVDDEGEYDTCDIEADKPEAWTPQPGPIVFAGRKGGAR